MPTIILKNTTGINQPLADLGTFVPASGQWDISDAPNLRDVGSSNSVRTLVQAGTLVVNDGSNDLSVDDGLAYVATAWVFSGFATPPSGLAKYPYMPFRGCRHWALQQSDGMTSVVALGYGVLPTVNGTPSLVSDATGQYLQYLSSGQINRDAGWASATFNQVRRQEGPSYLLRWKSGPAATDITNVRYWIGLFTASPMTVAALGAIQGAAFRYSTDVDGTVFWRTVTSDGANQTVTTTTVAVTTGTAYEFLIDMSNVGRVDFYINGALVATHMTTLPASATQLGHIQMLRTLTAVARNIWISRLFVDHR